MIRALNQSPARSTYSVQYACIYRPHWYDVESEPLTLSGAIKIARSVAQQTGRTARVIDAAGRPTAGHVFTP